MTVQVHRMTHHCIVSDFEPHNFAAFYQDFAQTQTITAVQAELIPKILDQIVLDIFNKTAGEW